MRFSERLKALREENNMSQKTLAELLSVSTRTIQNYEAGSRFPQSTRITNKICEVFSVSQRDLFSEEDTFVIEAAERGPRARTQAEELVSNARGLFAGGQLGEDDMDAAFRAITDAYWFAKEKNKKYTPKKYLEGDGDK